MTRVMLTYHLRLVGLPWLSSCSISAVVLQRVSSELRNNNSFPRRNLGRYLSIQVGWCAWTYRQAMKSCMCH